MVEKFIINEHNYCGNCPECEYSWDNGIISENVANILKLSESGPRGISKLVKIEPSDGASWFEGFSVYYKCPNCNIAWNAESGERTDKYKDMLFDSSKMSELLERIKKSGLI